MSSMREVVFGSTAALLDVAKYCVLALNRVYTRLVCADVMIGTHHIPKRS